MFARPFANFINLAVSVLMNDWFGKSNNVVLGGFGLARKAETRVVFIVEIDSFDVTPTIKREFMTCVYPSMIFLSSSHRLSLLGFLFRLI